MQTLTNNENMIFRKINPMIKNAMSFSQVKEAKRLIKIAVSLSKKEDEKVVQKIDEEYIFGKINPLIEESMTNEQKRETKRLIKLALPKQTEKLISINLSFWFFKLFYITFYLGSEKRELNRKIGLNTILQVAFVVFSTIFVFLALASVVFAIFLAFYYLKSLLGIDLFDMHLLP